MNHGWYVNLKLRTCFHNVQVQCPCLTHAASIHNPAILGAQRCPKNFVQVVSECDNLSCAEEGVGLAQSLRAHLLRCAHDDFHRCALGFCRQWQTSQRAIQHIRHHAARTLGKIRQLTSVCNTQAKSTRHHLPSMEVGGPTGPPTGNAGASSCRLAHLACGCTPAGSLH